MGKALPEFNGPSQIHWPPPPADWTLGADEIHVWAASLDATPSTHSVSILSPVERQRAARFRFELHRNRFTIGRALLRTILGRYLGKHPADLEFTYGANAKP